MKCPKPQYYNCEQRTNCKLCIKDTRCKVYTSIIECTKSQKFDRYVTREIQCTCVSKKYCVKCKKLRGKYWDFEDLPPKCDTDRKFIIFLTKFRN